MSPSVEDEAGLEVSALQAVIAALQPLDSETRARIVDTVAVFFSVATVRPRPQVTHAGTTDNVTAEVTRGYPSFSEDTTMSPKEFLFQKQPRTDVERVAVLAYYLTHYRDTPHFKTLELSKLNTEAAQPKFANTANSAANAVKQGYLVPSTKGNRQLSAAGERFVNLLPDREGARAAMAAAQPRRRRRGAPRANQSRPAPPQVDRPGSATGDR